jgi:hypothetical protein
MMRKKARGQCFRIKGQTSGILEAKPVPLPSSGFSLGFDGKNRNNVACQQV